MKITKQQNIDFGVVLTLALLLVALWINVPVLFKVCVATLLITALAPALYTPLSWLWFNLARLIEMVFSQLVLGVIFYLVLTPVGLLRRWLAKDNLHLKCFAKTKSSVFAIRDKKYGKEDLKNQF